MKRALIISSFWLILFLPAYSFGATITSAASGLNTSGSTWVGGVVPAASDNIIIASGHTVTVAATITFTGSFTINGTFQLAGFSVTVGDLQGTGSLTSSSGTPSFTTGSNNTSTTFSGVISTGIVLTKTGTGVLTLSGNNTYTGSTTVSAGTLQLNSTNALGTTAGATSVTSGAVLDLDGIKYSNAEVLTLNGTGISTGGALINSNATAASYAGNITLGATAPQITANNPITLSGVISGTAALNMAGTSTLTLSGTNTNSGIDTIIAGCTLKLGNPVALGSALSTSTDYTQVNDGASLDLNGTNYSTAEFLRLGVSSTGGTLINSSSTTATFAGKVDLYAVSTITTDNPIVISGQIASAGFGYIKTGASTLTVTSLNSTWGYPITISAGTLIVGSASALGASTTSAVTVNTGGALDLNGINHTALRNLTLNGIGISGGGAVINSSATGATYPGAVTLGSASSIVGGTGTIAITGTITGATFGLTLGGASGGTVTGIIGGTGTSVTKADAGTWILSGLNTYTGTTTVSAGILRATNNTIVASTSGAFGNNASGLVLNGGTIQSNVATFSRPVTITGTNSGLDAYGSARTLSSTITLSTAGTFNLNAGGITAAGAEGQNLTLSGVISYSAGTLSLTKIGTSNLSFGSQAITLLNLTISAGTLTSTSGFLNLAGNFSNSGTFTHNSGTLNFNGNSPQTIGGATFNNLTINNAAGVTLTAAVTYGATLTFSSGIIATGVYTLIATSTATVSRTSGHVNGNFKKNVATGATSKTFEVGGPTNYTPVTVAFASVTTAGDLTASVVSGDHANIGTSTINAAKSVNRNWTLTNSGIVFTTYSPTFTFVAGDVDAGASTAAFIVGKYSGGSWTYPTVGTKAATTTQATGLTAFGDFQLGELGYNISGSVFEDVNYGGGVGRSLASSSGATRPSARVELYNSGGNYQTFATTDGSGSYAFSGLVASTYTVRVVNGSVTTSRGVLASTTPTQTFRTNASSGAAVAVTDRVGGETPGLIDAADGSTTLAALTTGPTTAQSITSVALSSGDISGVDFGYNFNVIVNANNSGQGSLRRVLIYANAMSNTGLAQSGLTAGIDNAVFMLADGTARAGLTASYPSLFTSGIASIALATALPTITDPIILDATLQPGYTSLPMIELNGAGAGASTSGLTITSGGSTVRGLIINRFTAYGVSLSTTGSNTIAANYLGTNATGTAASANTTAGIKVSSSGNIIGGTTTAARNILSGNGSFGIDITGSSNIVQGNYIGSNVAGTGGIANVFGVYINGGATGNTIGGTATGAGNVISGNANTGLIIGASTSNTVQGNYIGTNAAGTAPLANGSIGLYIVTAANNNTIGGTTAGARNVISGNTNTGVDIDGSTGIIFQGNYVGVNAAGTAILANGVTGFYLHNGANNSVVGGTAAGAGNVISGNTSFGIAITNSTGANFQGNFVGTNPAGTSALANGTGFYIFINGSSNTIGGTTAAARNIISGNASYGLYIENGSSSNIVKGNYIGVNAAGTAAVANGITGVRILNGATNNTVGGTAAGAGNVISGNTSFGIAFDGATTTGNLVQGNFIGTNAAVTASVANGLVGVYVINSSTNNTIGGTAAGAGNVISGNGKGVSLAAGTGNAILSNSIYGNTGIGIDLANDGVTVNDGAKSGTLANSGMDTPVFTAMSLVGSTLTISGYVGSAAGQTTFAGASVQVFKSDNDSSGYGEGQTYLGTLTADASGNFSGTLTATLTLGDKITGTATDASNNTSEFAANVTSAAPPHAPSLGAAASFAVLAGTTITSTGLTVVSGNVGVSPGTAVTGFPPGVIQNGQIYSGSGSLAGPAEASALTAYNDLKGQACLPANNLSGKILGVTTGAVTLAPGIYCFDTSAQLTTTLTLNDGGDPNAIFIFQIGTTLTTASGAQVVMSSGGRGANVYWQIGTSATIGTFTALRGNVIASTSITMTTSASTTGRLFALDGAVTMDTNAVDAVPGASAPPNVALLNSVTPSGTQPPGTDLVYTVAFTNGGGQAARVFFVIDPVPAQTDFKLGSPSTVLATTGMTVAVEYSNDNAATWNGTPVSGGGGALAGYDRAVTHVRWRFTGNLSQISPNNTGSVSFTARIR